MEEGEIPNDDLTRFFRLEILAIIELILAKIERILAKIYCRKGAAALRANG
jgi:hypothetical protein